MPAACTVGRSALRVKFACQRQPLHEFFRISRHSQPCSSPFSFPFSAPLHQYLPAVAASSSQLLASARATNGTPGAGKRQAYSSFCLPSAQPFLTADLSAQHLFRLTPRRRAPQTPVLYPHQFRLPGQALCLAGRTPRWDS